jgi:hypothetical protein
MGGRKAGGPPPLPVNGPRASDRPGKGISSDAKENTPKVQSAPGLPPPPIEKREVRERAFELMAALEDCDLYSNLTMHALAYALLRVEQRLHGTTDQAACSALAKTFESMAARARAREKS